MHFAVTAKLSGLFEKFPDVFSLQEFYFLEVVGVVVAVGGWVGRANSLEDTPLRAVALHSRAVILLARGGGKAEDMGQLRVERMMGPVLSTVSSSEPLAFKRAAATVWEMDGFNRMPY